MTGESRARSWQSVRDEVLRRIHSRTWKPGDAIPKEADLAAEFGCARTTMNRALRDLAQQGILERKRKSGTRVALHPVGRAVLDIPLIRHDIEQSGRHYGYRLLLHTLVPAGRTANAAPNLPGTTPLLHIRALHLADGYAHVFEDRWINLAEVPQAAKIDFSTRSPNEWLLENIPFTGGELAISATACPAETARDMALPAGTPMLALDRTTWNGAHVITSVRLLHMPGHRLLSPVSG